MHRASAATRHATRLVPATLFIALLVSCGPPPEPCLANCPNVGGVFHIETSQASGQCDFMPLIVSGALTVVQSADTTSVSSEVRDTVSQNQVQLSGEVYLPVERDPPGTQASFNMLSQFVRPAFEDDPRLVTLRIILAGSVRETEGRRVLDGSLTSTDITPGQTGSCSVTISFTAIDRSFGQSDGGGNGNGEE